MRELSERQKWFRSMINKTIWRNNYCDCSICKSVYENGLVIGDTMQADYCYDNECDFTAGGDPLRYFETKEERDAFEKTIEPH